MFRFFIPIIILIFGGVLYTGYIQDAREDIQSLHNDINKLDDALVTDRERIQEKIQELAAANARIDQEDKDKLERLAPPKENFDLPTFLYDIYNVVVVTGGKELEGLTATVGSEVVDGYGTANVSFSVRATYDEFKEFITILEKNEQLFDIESVSFSAPSSEDGESTYSVALTAYWLP